MGAWDQNGGNGVRDEESAANWTANGTEKEKLDAGALFVLQSKGSYKIFICYYSYYY